MTQEAEVQQESEVMTTKEAAAFLRIGTLSLSQKAKRGEIPATKRLGHWRFLRSELLAWLKTKPESEAVQ